MEQAHYHFTWSHPIRSLNTFFHMNIFQMHSLRLINNSWWACNAPVSAPHGMLRLIYQNSFHAHIFWKCKNCMSVACWNFSSDLQSNQIHRLIVLVVIYRGKIDVLRIYVHTYSRNKLHYEPKSFDYWDSGQCISISVVKIGNENTKSKLHWNRRPTELQCQRAS